MPLHAGTPARERILGMGVGGAGKTRAWLTIAKKAEMLKSPGTFYVLDTDAAVERMLAGDNFAILRDRTQYMRHEANRDTSKPGTWVLDESRGVVDNPRMYVCELESWGESMWPCYVDFSKQFARLVTNDDWIVVDLFSPAWGEVHDYYVDTVHKKDVAAFYLAARGQKGNPLDGDKDWSNINRMYREFIGPLNRLRCHLFITTSVKDLQTEGARADKKDVRLLFGTAGVKPEGQKMTHHLTHTIIYFREFMPGEWHMTVLKDRERQKPAADIVHRDFVSDYLIPIAGWKLV